MFIHHCLIVLWLPRLWKAFHNKSVNASHLKCWKFIKRQQEDTDYKSNILLCFCDSFACCHCLCLLLHLVCLSFMHIFHNCCSNSGSRVSILKYCISFTVAMLEDASLGNHEVLKYFTLLNIKSLINLVSLNYFVIYNFLIKCNVR